MGNHDSYPPDFFPGHQNFFLIFRYSYISGTREGRDSITPPKNYLLGQFNISATRTVNSCFWTQCVNFQFYYGSDKYGKDCFEKMPKT